MDSKTSGNDKLPDFKQLTDRFIVEATPEPMLVIKTNLDPKEATDENPYLENLVPVDIKKFKNYFEERKN